MKDRTAASDTPGNPAPDEEGLERELGEGRSWRRVFAEDFHPLDTDERVRLAREASGEALCALCFDPSHKVVAAILDNPRAGLEHARLIARHHRTSVGLDEIGRRARFLRDGPVQRYLFRNPQLGDLLLRRILRPKRLDEVYRLCLSRESTDRVRNRTKKALRDKFTSATAEERVSLILRCEGRCLPLLLGLPLGGRAAALLCQRSMHSTMLIQNLARWPATPPPVLLHMARQPLVKRSPILKNMILRHPNAPAQLKDGGRV